MICRELCNRALGQSLICLYVQRIFSHLRLPTAWPALVEVFSTWCANVGDNFALHFRKLQMLMYLGCPYLPSNLLPRLPTYLSTHLINQSTNESMKLSCVLESSFDVYLVCYNRAVNVHARGHGLQSLGQVNQDELERKRMKTLEHQVTSLLADLSFLSNIFSTSCNLGLMFLTVSTVLNHS